MADVDGIPPAAATVCGQKRGRSDKRAVSVKKSYVGLVFEPIASTGRPGTPHCYFDASYRVTLVDDHQEKDCTSSLRSPRPVVHRHANGLCVITAGDIEGVDFESVQLLVEAASSVSSSAASLKNDTKAKKKRQGQDISDNVQPKDPLATIVLKDGTTVSLPCCVFGTVVEMNEHVTPELLASDPLLAGYFAVIRPMGAFPPKRRSSVGDETSRVVDAPASES